MFRNHEDGCDVHNAIVDQKNDIINRINTAEDGKDLEAVASLVLFLKPLWEAVDYGYKVRELRQRIIDRADQLAEGIRGVLGSSRKNFKGRSLFETDLRRLEAMSAYTKAIS